MTPPCVKKDKYTYKSELESYNDMWDDIYRNGKVRIQTPEQMKRYKQYISLLLEYISMYDDN